MKIGKVNASETETKVKHTVTNTNGRIIEENLKMKTTLDAKITDTVDDADTTVAIKSFKSSEMLLFVVDRLTNHTRCILFL